MKADVTEIIPGASVESLFAEVASLDRYPPWMRLVHRATPLDDASTGQGADGRPAWWVELRARVGPLARSKQLRMVRTAFELGRHVRFERAELDGRDHAAWVLDARVAEAQGGAELSMGLEYTGQLWSAAVLGRILDDEIRRGAAQLTALVGSPSPTP
ncbi:hypothetical protein BH24ACT5_BH24ACT5_01340 [soil metagenome]